MNIGSCLLSIRNCSLAALFLFIVAGSIYGLFVSELSIRLGSNPDFYFALSGWPKNLLCLSGLFLAGAVAVYPILLAVYRALSNGNA
jgi:RsiW-degrading membrane proteinase PrsW (M82 family)